MSMAHKAFSFNWRAFESELGAPLDQALETGELAALASFIADNAQSLRDPDTGRSIGRDWDRSITLRDVQRYGDLALTKFYDPRQDIGLGDEWEEVQEHLKMADVDPAIILGAPFGPSTNYFDPGKMGSYFQTPDEVARHLRILLDLTAKQMDTPDEAIALFCQVHGGLYVTF